MKSFIFRNFRAVWNRAINRAWGERAKERRYAAKKIGRIPDEVTINQCDKVRAVR